MTNIAFFDLISELESVVKHGSAHRRVHILRQITCLFLSGIDRLNEQHIGVYDDIFVRLMECSGTEILARLSCAFADLASAPKHAIRNLALHEDAAVAGPVPNPTCAVHARLLSAAPPGTRGTIEVAIESVAARAGAKKPDPVDYSEAKSTALSLNNAGKLNDSSVNRFAVRGEQTKLI